MKQKIVKGPRKPPKRVAKTRTVMIAELCPCNIDDFEAWVVHNMTELVCMFLAHVYAGILEGQQPPPPEEFENFCTQMHTRCRQVVASEQSRNTTLH